MSDGRRRTVTWGLRAAFVILGLAACAPSVGIRLDARPHGAPVSVPARPSDADCVALIRGEQRVSVSVRAALGVDGVDDTAEAAERAAADPDADYAVLGIPLTAEEVDQIRSSSDAPGATVGLAGLIAARPELMGTLWLEGGTLVVTILSPESTALRLARCLERGEFIGTVRYVTAGTPPADLAALGERINSERSVLARDGIDVTVIETDLATETVMVGVTSRTPEIEARLVERYGSVVRVVEVSGPGRAWPPQDPGPGG